MSNPTAEKLSKADKNICQAHADGEHCWHSYGNTGYTGKYQTTIPVECCHCKMKAKKIQFYPTEDIVYD